MVLYVCVYRIYSTVQVYSTVLYVHSVLYCTTLDDKKEKETEETRGYWLVNFHLGGCIIGSTYI